MTTEQKFPDPVEPDADLDARGLRAWIESADPDDPECDDVVMVVSDGDTTFRIVSGMGERARLARLGADRLVAVARQFGALLGAREPRSVHGSLNGP